MRSVGGYVPKPAPARRTPGRQEIRSAREHASAAPQQAAAAAAVGSAQAIVAYDARGRVTNLLGIFQATALSGVTSLEVRVGHCVAWSVHCALSSGVVTLDGLHRLQLGILIIVRIGVRGGATRAPQSLNFACSAA